MIAPQAEARPAPARADRAERGLDDAGRARRTGPRDTSLMVSSGRIVGSDLASTRRTRRVDRGRDSTSPGTGLTHHITTRIIGSVKSLYMGARSIDPTLRRQMEATLRRSGAPSPEKQRREGLQAFVRSRAFAGGDVRNDRPLGLSSLRRECLRHRNAAGRRALSSDEAAPLTHSCTCACDGGRQRFSRYRTGRFPRRSGSDRRHSSRASVEFDSCALRA